MAMRAWGGGVFLMVALATGGWLLMPPAGAEEGADPFAVQEGPDPFAGEDPFGEGGKDPFGESGGDPFGSADQQPSEQQSSDQRREEEIRRHEQERERVREQPRGRERPAADPHRQPVFWAEPHSESSEGIRRALDAKLTSVGLEFVETPVEEVVDFLRDAYEIEIQLDETALDDLGISTDEQITVNLRNITLKSALRLMLKQLELTYVIADEVLLITSEEEAETRLTVGIYPMRGIASGEDELRELSRVITATIASETWAIHKGGEAELKELSAGFLVISQTRAVHEEVIEFLSALRRAKAAGENRRGATADIDPF